MSKKYHNKEEFIDAIDQDYSWRRIELLCVKKQVVTANEKAKAKDKTTPMAIRQGILLLYAHWEGFIKFSATAYLQFIVDCGFKQCDLTDNFLGIMLRKKYLGKCNTYSLKHHISVARGLLNDSQQRVVFEPEKIIRTNANLSYELFENILDTLAIDTRKYETKRQLINESLLARRNKIAHGEGNIPAFDSFIDLFQSVFDMLDCFKNDIQNLCATEGYKK